MKITLASTSKFKNSILDTVHIKHDQISPNCKEISNFKDPYKYVKDISKQKLDSVSNYNTDILISLDTIVLINNKIVEKPKSIEEAKQNLRNSSNTTSKVITGIAMLNKKTNEVLVDYQETLVTFNEIDEEDIEYYIENEKDAMYASGFIVETICSNFIKEIKGSYYNILGVPVEKIYEILRKWDIKLKNID
jgi:septum formation protein